QKAPGDWRTPGRFARFDAATMSARFWSAPVLSLSRNSKVAPKNFEKHHQNTFAQNQNAPDRKCGSRFFRQWRALRVSRQTLLWRTPKPGGLRCGLDWREASWSAPVLWRFGLGTAIFGKKSAFLIRRDARAFFS